VARLDFAPSFRERLVRDWYLPPLTLLTATLVPLSWLFRGIAGVAPSLIAPPAGCAFHPRCPRAAARCAAEAPPPLPLGDGRLVRCHFATEEADAA